MMAALFIIHGLLAVALLGAMTHHATTVWLPARTGAQFFAARLRSVSALSPIASRRCGRG